MSRLAAIGAGVMLVAFQAGAQEPRRLDESQRSQILSLIKAVDRTQASGTAIEPAPGAWSMHLLKSAAGMNYVPMSLAIDAPGSGSPLGVYVRVVARTPAQPAATSLLERWLAIESVKPAPPPAPYRGFVSVNAEDMPVGIATMSSRSAVREPGAASVALELSERQQRREEEKRRAAEQTRREQEEQSDVAGRRGDEFIYPFEDFGFASAQAAGRPGAVLVERAVAVPPGEYDLYVAVSGTGSAAPSVYRTPLSVPTYDRDELMLSSVILAERLEVLPSPYPVDEQSSHPYALGWTQIVPARDSLFTDADELGLVFQVLNPVPDARGKPDVAVEYSFLLTNGRADPLTARQDFSSRTLPDEFDLQKGHQVFAAQAVPLKTFAPGHYRVALAVTDNVARRTVTRELAVTVRATPQSLWLLKTVDGLIAPPFRRSQVLSTGAVTEALDELADLQTLTPAQSKAAADAREGRYAAVLGAMPAPADLASSFLRGLALMALNDNLEAAAGQFREALRFSSEFMPATVYLGACLAANGRDREAMAAWQLASAADTPTPLATELLADALMRTGNHESALDLLTEASTRWKDAPGIARRIAAVQVKAGRREEALVALDTVIEADAGDLDSLFLAIYLLAGGQPPASLTAAEREKLARYARTYVEATGPYRAIVEQWIADRERGN